TLASLASTTSLLLLLVFSIVNASLMTMHLHEKRNPIQFSIPLAIPITAIVTCLTLIFFVQHSSFWWLLGILTLGSGLAVLAHRRQVVIEDLETTTSQKND
ncbi:MAG: hypothetical protein KDA84_18260, partial [Planctomycetaceae bacterium]|nr:hypothetical protein [Planctomycetaceae bacterium]